MTNAFLYKWTHIPTLRWYVGSRTAKGCHPNDGYICSSKKVKPMILENKEEWRREIIAIGDSSEILDLESEVLQLLDARNDPRSFNEHNNDKKFSMTGKVGGRKGKTPWNKGLTKSMAPNLKGGKKKGTTAWNKGKTGATPWNKGKKTGHTPWNKGLPKEQQPFYGKTFNEETLNILRNQKLGDKNPNFGKTPWNKKITKETV